MYFLKKFLILVEFSISYDFLNCGKCRQKRRHFGSSPSENLFLENGASDVNARTDFPAITEKSTHFLQSADLRSLLIDCGGRKCRRFALLLVVARETHGKSLLYKISHLWSFCLLIVKVSVSTLLEICISSGYKSSNGNSKDCLL